MNYTVNGRYQVDCSICGHLVSERSLRKAIHTAQFLADLRHNLEGEQITIYNTLAHRGKPDLYSKDGKIISTREW